MIRPVLGMIFSECYGRKWDFIEKNQNEDFENNKDILFICGLTELIHNGSLIIDDIEDKSLMRRGDKCIHIKYGTDYAVNSGNLMYFAPITKLE
jgi:geranylgeranyl pyrophosphate synthase